MKGYVKLHRKIMESSIWTDAHFYKLFNYCIMKARHDPVPGYEIWEKQDVTIGPGQFVTGRYALYRDYNKGVSEKNSIPAITLWKWLKKLEKMEMLNINSTNKYSIVTVVNWEEYQTNLVKENNKGTTEEQQENNKGSAKDQQENTNKNVKNGKNDKNVKKKEKEASKLTFLEFVTLTKEEHEKLEKELGESLRDKLIRNLNDYIGSTGKKYRSHYHTVLTWSRKESNQGKKGANKNGQVRPDNGGASFEELSEKSNKRNRERIEAERKSSPESELPL